MAFEAGEWTDVLDLTTRIVEVDPSSHAGTTGYIVDFDRVNYTEVYFYETVANLKLNKIAEAEKSGLQAEKFLDVGTRFPQLHLTMAEIYSRKNNFANAASELEMYLELRPHAENAGRVRELLLRMKSPSGPISTQQ
jgi:hypothetical protein